MTKTKVGVITQQTDGQKKDSFNPHKKTWSKIKLQAISTLENNLLTGEPMSHSQL